MRRKVNPVVEVPADAGETQQPVAGEESVALAPEAHEAPRPPRVRPLHKPVEPTRAQRELHELTHYPFEAWCRHCARCKASDAPHRSLHWHAQGAQVPVISGDFAFLVQRDQVGTTTIFVFGDRATRRTFAHMVRGKSTSREVYSDYIVSAVCRDLDSLSYGKLIFKSDQEPLTLALQRG